MFWLLYLSTVLEKRMDGTAEKVITLLFHLVTLAIASMDSHQTSASKNSVKLLYLLAVYILMF